jgi:endonuclease YncB( thermonuclease family)
MDGVKVRVQRIVDGDTVVALDLQTGAPLRIRFAFVDAPERRQPYGAEATAALTALLFPPPDPDSRALQDEAGIAYFTRTTSAHSYGREVGTLWTHRYGDIGQAMVREGHAWAYEKFLRRRQHSRMLPYYLDMQAEARAQRKGLWQDAAPVPPWEWRRTRAQPYNKGIGCDVCSQCPSALVCPHTLGQYCSAACYLAPP